MDKVNITIIGAGAIGLALAAALAADYGDIVVLERHTSFGQEVSSRNSEVIHAGIYYPTGSLKAKLCIDGAESLYEYCDRNTIPYKKLGKLIVATEESEIPALETLLEQGNQNGVAGLRIIDKTSVNRMEPQIRARAALHSPGSGIFDTHAFMKSLYNKADAGEVLFSFGSEVDRIDKQNEGYIIGLRNDDYTFLTRAVINAAGLSSDHVAGLAGVDVNKCGCRLRYVKGSYFSYEKPSPVGMLVYPVPHDNLTGLGVHATLDLGGRLRFGPDAEDVDVLDYSVNSGKRDAFFEGASKMIEGLDRESFVPDMAGIRPKIQGEGVMDFVIRHEADNGLHNFIDLIGIESPGLTASLAIADHVKNIVKEIYA